MNGVWRRASFSASPCHLDVSEDAEMAKKVARASAASALASSVFPLPARALRGLGSAVQGHLGRTL